MLKSTCGIFPVRDLDRAAAFYAALGFRETGRWTGNGYLIMEQDAIELHFAHNPELTPEDSQCAIYIRSEDVDAFSDRAASYDSWTDRFPRFKAAEDKDWDMREVHILDPDGNLLRIGQFS